jgi:hypothetical protein
MTTQDYNIRARVQGKRDVESLGSALKNNEKALMSLGKAATLAGVALAGIATVKFVKGLVSVGKEVESLQLRFKFLFGSAEEGAAAFKTLTDFAAGVPFSLQDIALASGNLAIVSKDAEELNDVLAITANVAAVSGIDFRTAGEQIQRAFSTGAASADIFRERGVLALLGFKQGVQTTAEETRRRFTEVFGEGGEFGKAAEEFANTLEGTLSMLGDKFFKFQTTVNESFFEALKGELGNLNDFFDDNQDGIDEFAESVGEALAGAVVNAGKAVVFLKDNVEILKIAFGGLAIIAVANGFVKFANTLVALTGIVRALTAAMLKNPLFVLLAGAALTALFIFRDEINGLIEDIMGTSEELEELTMHNEHYNASIERSTQRLREEKKARKEKIEAVKKEIEVSQEFLKKNKSNLETIDRLLEDELDTVIRKEQEQKALIEEGLKKKAFSYEVAAQRIQKIEENAAAKRKAIYDKELAQIQRNQEARISAIKQGNFKDLDLATATEEEKREVAVAGARSALEQIAQVNRRAFELNKAVAITEAIINTYQGATKALAQGGVFGPLLAGAIVASGLAQVAIIRNQQYPGREMGGTTMGNQPFVIGEAGPEVFVPGRTGTVVPNDAMKGGQQTINLNFNITATDTKDFDKLIRSRQSVFIGMINQALNEQGRRALV